MKLSLIFMCTFVFIFEYSDCDTVTEKVWFPNYLIDRIHLQTSQLGKYVEATGRTLKNYYVRNVRGKLSSFFADSDGNKTNEKKPTRSKVKFRPRVDPARANNDYIIDDVPPDRDQYERVDVAPDPDLYARVHYERAPNPTVYLTTPQLIALHGYMSESHTITTEDGYILTAHRIPFARNASYKLSPRKTVLMHHGLLGSSADWVIPGPNKGLAYILADAGYDVWLANVRGNSYSRAHVSLDIGSYEFWNFTFHEVSQHDLPALIDYIMEVKGWDVKINYIGHSMGTTVLFALLSTKTHYNKILRAGFALAPVAYMTNIRSPIKLLVRYVTNIEFIMKLLGANEFLPQSSVLRWLSRHACEINKYEEAFCENSLFVLCGYDEMQFNKTLMPMILGHVPAGASTKTLIHYAQEIQNAGKFQQFDYGRKGNIRQYGSPYPPQYPIHKITLPIALFSSENDWLSSDIDVANLFAQLVNPIDHYVVPLREFNHMDFLWAIDAPRLLYAKLLRLLGDGVGMRSQNGQHELDKLLNLKNFV